MRRAEGSVWLDARGTQSAAHGERGVARYIAEHAQALVAGVPESIGSIGLDPEAPVPRSMEPLAQSGLLSWHRRTRAPVRPPPGIYHVMSPFEVTIGLDDISPAWIREAGSRLVVTLYDLIPMVMRDHYLAEWGHNGAAWRARLGLIRAADQVLTISQHTADDAMEHLGIPEERITVVDSGVSGAHSSLVAHRQQAERCCDERCQGSAGLPPLRGRRRPPQEHGGHDPRVRAAAQVGAGRPPAGDRFQDRHLPGRAPSLRPDTRDQAARPGPDRVRQRRAAGSARSQLRALHLSLPL